MGKVRRFLSSIFESQDAVEEKEDVDKKLEKILESINRDDDDRGELVSLVEELHESYQSLHGRYGHLMEKLKTSSLRNKKDSNGGSSSDTSSDSDDGDDEYKSLKKQVHVWKLKNKDAEDKVVLLNSELNTAQHFNSLVSNKLSEAENKVGVIKHETDNLKAEIGKLSGENAVLKDELEKTSHLMENQMRLMSELQILNLKLEVSTKHVSDLEMQVNNLKEEKDVLHLENVKILSSVEEFKKDSDEKLSEINSLKFNLGELKTGIKLSEEKNLQLIKNSNVKDDEKELLSKEYEERISELIKNLKIKDDEKELLSKEYEEKISELNKNSKIKDNEKELLSKEYEEKISEQIKNMKIKDDEKELLSKEYEEKISELNKNLKIKDGEKELLSKEYEEKISELIKNSKIKDNEKELLSKEYKERISELIKNLKIKDDEKELLSKEYEEKISEQIKNSKIKDDEKELLSKEYEEKISEQIKNMKIKDDEKELLSKEYEEKISELIKNLKIKDDEKELLSKEYEEKISEAVKNVKTKDDEEEELLSREYEEKISELIKNLKIKDDEKELLSKEYEEKISELIKNLKMKDNEKELLSKEYETLKSEKDATDDKIIKFRMTVQQLDSEKMALVNEMDGVKRDGSELVRRLELEKNEISAKIFECEVKFDELTSDYEILEDQFKQSCTNLDFAQSKIAELEINVALANQRHKADDEINVGRIKELLRERKGLEDILTLEFSRLNNVFRDTELEFEKTRGHLHSQLTQCRGELQEVKESLISKKHELMERAEHSRDEIKGLQGQLREKTVEEKELKRKLVIMDIMLKDKEEEGKCKDEDKREAIRQLCIQIEYHRLNSIHLFQILSKKMKRNRG
ncbi:hypothetical protein ZOSMA_2G03180 [Zostera marina]|uniref:NAB domain-containing protein n=1 Tax=Zostera marina TaxID=29655 RepID=A0A0K9PDI3_ZOSMR|nr:hypothetical protein ZOSMA_2G03180 [Zostera marina]